MTSAEPVTSAIAHHGEGPFWDEAADRVLFVDMLAGRILARGADGAVTAHPVPGTAATVIRRRATGGFAVTTNDRLLACDDGFADFVPIATVHADAAIRLNEGGCDPLGRFFIGSMAYDETTGAGAVFRIGTDGAVDVVLPEVTISNGLQWSADGTRALYVDTPTRRVDRFDVDPSTGEWSNRRPHIDVADASGFPDGTAIDEEDGLWVAFFGGSAVRHYDAAARLVESIAVPGASQVTACAFGGPDRSTLFITTSRQDLAPVEEPQAGALWAVGTSYRGAVPHPFRG